MITLQSVATYVQNWGVVDFGSELEGIGVLWFNGVNGHHIIVAPNDSTMVLSVWDNDRCGDLVDEIEFTTLDELNTLVQKYAVSNQG